MCQNFFGPFDGHFKAENYNILIFTQIFFVHISVSPNLEYYSVHLNSEEPKL
jgi:hypothetical protein